MKLENKKFLFCFLTLFILLFGVSIVSATDINSTSDTTTHIEHSTPQLTLNHETVTENKAIKKEAKNKSITDKTTKKQSVINKEVNNWKELNKTVTEANNDNNEYHIKLNNGTYYTTENNYYSETVITTPTIKWGTNTSQMKLVIDGNNQTLIGGGFNISSNHTLKLNNLHFSKGSKEEVQAKYTAYTLKVSIRNNGTLEVTSVNIDDDNQEIINSGVIILNNYTIANGNPGGSVVFNNCVINGTFGGNGTLIINDNTVIGKNATLTGNPVIITNKTLNINNFYNRKFNSTSVLTNVTIIYGSNYGNLTLINSTINDKVLDNGIRTGTFSNYGNLTLVNSVSSSEIKNNENSVLVLQNSTLGNEVVNNGTIVIADDVIFADGFRLINNGKITTNRSDVNNYLYYFDGNYTLNNAVLSQMQFNTGNLTLNNSTLNGTLNNQGKLVLNHSILNGAINNYGTLIIDDNTVFGINAVISNTENSTLITNKTDIVNHYYTYNGNYSFNNVNFTTSRRNTGNLTITNSNIRGITNSGNLVIINSTINNINAWSNHANVTVINSTVSHITGDGFDNLNLINVTMYNNKFNNSRDACIRITSNDNSNNINITIINSSFINNTNNFHNSSIGYADIYIGGYGGISWLSSNVIIRNTTFIGTGLGGGAYIASRNMTTIDNCTFKNKTVYDRDSNRGLAYYGAALRLEGTQNILVNSTVFENNVMDTKSGWTTDHGVAIALGHHFRNASLTGNIFKNNTGASNIYIAAPYNNPDLSKVIFTGNTVINGDFMSTDTDLNSRRYPDLTMTDNTFINTNMNYYYNSTNKLIENNTYTNCDIKLAEYKINDPGQVYLNDIINITASIKLNSSDMYDSNILKKARYEFYVDGSLYKTEDTPATTIKVTGNRMLIKVKASFTSRTSSTFILRTSKKTGSTIIITPKNIDSYIGDGELYGANENDIVYFRGNFTNLKEISIFTPGITINGANASFINTSFTLDEEHITITDMHINNTDTSEYTIISNAENNIISNNTIFTYNHDGKTAGIKNNKNSNNTITGNTIIVYGPGLTINYAGGSDTIANTQGILSFGGDNNIIRDNKIRVYNSTNPDDDAYSTMDGITAPGSSNNVLIENNDVFVTGGRFNYGIDVLGDINHTIIKGNNINVTGHRYVDGIQLGNGANNCIITDNKINLYCFNTTVFDADNEALAFGIITTNNGGFITSNATITNNQLNYSAPISYGMEIYQTHNVKIINNTFNGNGYYTMGLSLAHSPNVEITNNTMNLHGNSNIEINYIVEEIRPANTGIQVQQDSNNIIIDGNKITVDDIGNNDRAINLDTQKTALKNINITNNKLETRTQTGNNAINAVNINNLILRNNTGIKTNTTITINPITNTPYSDNITITGTLKDNNNNGIREANITITLNNKTYTTKTNNNGTYTLKITAQKMGTNRIIAKYNGNINYKTSNTTTTFNVTKINTEIKTSKITAKLGTTITITATIKDTNGNNITNGRVAIKINGKTFGYSNITNGRIRFNINLSPDNFGKYSYKVLFTYGGSNTHKETRQNTTLTITAFNPVFDVKITNATSIGNTATMTVKVSNGTGYNARSGTVGFKINGKTYKINGKAYTLKLHNGMATFKFNITKDMAGTKSITITYSGNSQFNQNRTTINNAITVKNKVTCTITNTKAIIGENAVLKAKFTGADGQILTSGKIAVKINGRTFGYTQIHNGTATYTLKLDPKKFSARNYTVTFKYGGSSTYTQVTANTTLQITKHTTKFNYTTTTAHRNTTAKITLKITDNKNTINANNGTVGIKINGKTYKVNGKAYTIKPVNGTATFTVNTNNLKTNNNITFTYSGYREFTGLKQTYNNGLRIRT